MPQQLSVSDFLMQAETAKMVDVRTPLEFAQGHIPNAINLPLLSNEERVIIGTLYKQNGRQAAILKGLEMVGAKARSFIEEVNLISTNNKILLHCWRGGMRSGSVAWMLELYGYKVGVLKGGYKAYRNLVLDIFNNKFQLNILGGKTGSAKTEILNYLAEKGESIIDLEGLAHHKGSAFGGIEETAQPTQEQFENDLADKIISINPSEKIWIEDESRNIGKRVIPQGLWQQMREATVFYIDAPLEIRIDFLKKIYGDFPKEELAAAIERIKKKLGGLDYKNIMEALEKGDADTVCSLLLKYYDKTYLNGIENRNKETIHPILLKSYESKAVAEELIRFKNNLI